MTEAAKTVPPPRMTIYEALPQITGLVAPIAKAKTNPQQGYKFRGVDDVYAVLNLLLARAGVTVAPEVLESSHDSYNTAKGALMFRHRVKVKYTLYASDGSHIAATVEGEGMDSGDKSTQKALSMAYKYMAFQVFCIPTGEKIDTEEDSPEVVATNGSAKKEENPDALCEELKQALIGAKDLAALEKTCLKIKEAHEKKQITDAHRKLLLAVYAGKKADLAPEAKA